MSAASTDGNALALARRIVEAAKNAVEFEESSVITRDALTLAKALLDGPSSDAVKALRACHAWHIAEEKNIGSFQAKSALCNYSEYLTEKALFRTDAAYEGVPRIYLFPVELVRDTAEECDHLIEEVFKRFDATHSDTSKEKE